MYQSETTAARAGIHCRISGKPNCARFNIQDRTNMGVVAIYSPKGGVGKTTISVDLAWRCAVQGGHKTSLLDLDVQGGSGFLLDADMNAFARDASLFEKPERMRRLITLTKFDNLFYLGMDSNLRNLSFDLLPKICAGHSTGSSSTVHRCKTK
jgi:hypothetical protein